MRVSSKEALELFELDLIELSRLAHKVRFEKHPTKLVTFIADTNINYTNICETKCSFCAFYRNKNDKDAYVLSIEQLKQKAIAAKELGLSTVLIQGGLNPEIEYSYYIKMVEELSNIGIHVHAFSPPEIDLMCKIANKSPKEVFEDLKKAGLQTMPGGGAEILSERVRKKISPKKISTDRWLEIMKAAHNTGLKTTATMMFGHIETKEDIIEHLENIRRLQDETSGFRAAIAWDFKPENTALKKLVTKKASGIDYLKILAITRIYLDNVENIQASWASQGKQIGQVALYFGANDLGSLLFEENVMAQAGFRVTSTVEELANLIKQAGFIPALRTTNYEIVRYL
ncbi:cyclic dehypoxanthinyl futalosine synthase [Desulfurella sp.]|uniref:cyclic dehypoxanthinyl futalosine synthase n=1 Tax=Desulfurella sp. TaxID=1962857 RepID=UPI0025C32ABA|nr:cyclic dehypoxanthinyl futalosine synthase [Desulfurella sp.]